MTARTSTELILGTAQLTMAYGALRPSDEAPTDDDAARLLVGARNIGVTALDTAPRYDGAEDAIGRHDATTPVHTKLDAGVPPAESLAASLARLGRDQVDVFYVDLDQVGPASELVGRGCGRIGVSIYDHHEYVTALADDRVDVVQVPLSLLDRRFRTPTAKTILARSALLQGVLVTPADQLRRGTQPLAPFVERFHALAADLGRTPLELALGWVAAQPVDGMILGVRTLAELSEIAAARPLTDHEMAALDALPQPDRSLVDPRTWHDRVVAVVQARTGSVRMPKKVLAPVLGQPVLGHLLDRLGRAETVDEVVVAVPEGDDALVAFCDERGVRCVQGSETDVLDRYRAAASAADVVVRVTGDCPLVDPSLVDEVVRLHQTTGGYARTGPTYPDGFDVEVCAAAALVEAATDATDPYDREHVMPYVRRHADEALIQLRTDLGGERVTLDEPDDLIVIEAVFEHFGHNEFTAGEVTRLMTERPDMFDANRHLARDEGATMGTGQKLWRRAKRVIPGGNMLLSKRAEQHLPSGWPAYFAKAQGCTVWDLDGNAFADVGLMGVGTNILGYGHPKVDEAVQRVVTAGNLSTLNCPEEVELAEALVGLHPWAEMARFTRGGGEACAVAVRIARAAAGSTRVAFCGYHGWHDWYLAANLGSGDGGQDGDSLDGHLLPGLAPQGVHRNLAGSAVPFTFNDLASLEAVFASGPVGVVFMEVQRGTPPAPGFLEGVRALADRHGAVLVFDECTSGFRRTLGGIHLAYGVEPDVAVFGKTLGNGYAINAVIGRSGVMQAAQDTFISSTFWTERIGPAAAVATLAAMADEDAPARVHQIGLDVRARWEALAADVGLTIETGGVPALGGWGIPHLDPVAVKTFVTGQMLAAGYLASTSLYASLAHTPDVLDRYLDDLRPVFARLAAVSDDDELLTLLPDGPSQRGFQRLA